MPLESLCCHPVVGIGVCRRPHNVLAFVWVRVSTMFKFSKVCVWRAALSSDNSCFYTLPHSNGGVLWYHIGCLWGCTSACLPDNNLRMSMDFTKFGVCIDILEIWFGIADGQISSIFDSYRPEIHQFLAHLSRRLMVSFCDHSPSVVGVVVVVVVRMSVCPQSLNNISS